MSWRRFFRREEWDAERTCEMEAHLAHETDEFVARGMSRDDAQAAAKRKFGNETKLREEIYEMNTVSWLDSLWQDVKYGARTLRKSPGYAALAILTLALGIGANTTIFSLLNAVVLRTVPVCDPANLYVLKWRANVAPNMDWSSSFGDCGQNDQAANPTGCSFPFDTYEKIRDNSAVFSSAAAFAGPTQLEMSGNGAAKIADATLVSGDFFSTLGVKPATGRTLAAADNVAGSAEVAVLSYAFWRHEFGGDPSVVGRVIELNKKAFTIAGVAEKSFTNLSPGKTEDMWIPIAGGQSLGIRWMQRPEDVANWWLVIVARLTPGVTPAQAQTAATIAFRNELIHGEKPISRESDNPGIVLEKVQKGLVGLRMFYSTRLYVLMGAVGLILLIACANVAGLLLARAAGRRKEIALRLVLGAGRGRVIRQLLIESVLLSGLGAGLGIALAYWGVEAITPLLGGDPLRGFPFIVELDWHVMLFTLAAAVLTGIFFGLAPAFRSTRVDLTSALKENAPTIAPVGNLGRFAILQRLGRLQMGSALVVIQVALSVIVMIGAGLMVRTLDKLRHLDTGFDPHNVLLFGVDPTHLGMSDERAQNLYREMRERFVALPGVTSASFSSFALVEGSDWTTLMRLNPDQAEQSIEVNMVAPGPNFLETMRIPLLAGRGFTPQDFEIAAKKNSDVRERMTAEAAGKPGSVAAGKLLALPALVNRAFVEKYLANQNPVGRGLYAGSRPGDSQGQGMPSREWEIVGVVGDTKYDTMRDAEAPLIFVPDASGGAEFEIRTAGDPNALVPTVRDAMAEINNEVPLIDIRTQTEQIDRELLEERFLAKLVSVVGLLAMVLACVGLYGLLSYEVSRRTREIGVRMALGAARIDVFSLVLGQGLVLALVGIAVGTAIAMGLTRYLESLLYGVKPNDPATFAAIGALILVVGALASYLPTRRATRVDPMVALRYE
jgi:predicted permease